VSWKKVFPKFVNSEEKGVSTVFEQWEKKNCFHREKKVFAQWFYSDKKGVSSIKKEVFSRCFYDEKKVFDLSFHGGISTVNTKNVSQQLKVSTVQVSTVFLECFNGE